MYVLFKKVPKGYPVDVEILAYSEDKTELMELLPYEVEKYIRSGANTMWPHQMKYHLPHGHEPLECWQAGAFRREEFGIMEVKHARLKKAKVKSEVHTLQAKNRKYLNETFPNIHVSADEYDD